MVITKSKHDCMLPGEKVVIKVNLIYKATRYMLSSEHYGHEWVFDKSQQKPYSKPGASKYQMVGSTIVN